MKPSRTAATIRNAALKARRPEFRLLLFASEAIFERSDYAGCRQRRLDRGQRRPDARDGEPVRPVTAAEMHL